MPRSATVLTLALATLGSAQAQFLPVITAQLLGAESSVDLAQAVQELGEAITDQEARVNPAAPHATRVTRAAADCQPVRVDTTGIVGIQLVFNLKSLYMEGYIRDGVYWAFKDLPTCHGQWTGTKAFLTFESTHLAQDYNVGPDSVNTALMYLKKQDPATLKPQSELRPRLDALSFLTSEAIRFASVLSAVAEDKPVGKNAFPVVNSWDAASAVFYSGATPTPPVAAALAQLHTVKRQ